MGIERLKLPYVQVEQLYIKWDEKISVTAEQLSVTGEKPEKSEPFDPGLLQKTIRILRLFDGWFEQIIIENIRFNETSASFSYNGNEEGFLYLFAPGYKLESAFNIENHYLYATVSRIGEREEQPKLDSVVAVDLEAFTLYSATDIVFPKVADLTLYLTADSSMADFSAVANAPINAIKPIVDLFGLPEEVSPWIADYTHGTRVHLHTLRGSLPYAQPERILETLYASATYDDLEYTFNQNLEPIRTDHTNVIFEKGKLNIYPVAPTFYSQSGGKSWLDIDFNPAHPTLNAYIITEAQLTDDILFLLHQYGIDLPFKQTSGTTKTDLTLHIDLVDLVVTDEGTFDVDSGEFVYNGLLFKATDAAVSLKDARISIDALQLAYEEMIDADVSGSIELSEGKGRLSARLKEVTFAGAELDSRTPVKLEYTIDPRGDRVALTSSSWQFAGKRIDVDAIKMPFAFATFSAKIPKTAVKIDTIATAKVSGKLNGSLPELALAIDIGRFDYNALRLKQPHMPLSLKYTDKAVLQSAKTAKWELDGRALTLAPFSMAFDEKEMALLQGAFTFEERYAANASGYYRFEESGGSFTLTDISAEDEKLGQLYRRKGAIDAHYSIEEDGSGFELASKELNATFSASEDEWSLAFADIGRLSRDSELMREFNLTSGSFMVHSAADSDAIELFGSIDYPYHLLVKDNKPISRYKLFGSLENNVTTLFLNNDLKIVLSEDTEITGEDIGFNIGAILAYLNDHKDETKAETAIPEFSLHADNTYIYMTPERRAPADSITLESEENMMDIALTYKGGNAVFEMDEKGVFHFYGHDFNDYFMSSLLPLSDFKGGKMAFIINGNTDRFNGSVQIKKTTLKDYKLLNNVLAFINTVPSLITFSLPDYNTQGLKTKEIYTRFFYDRGDIKLDAVYLDSKEVNIFGKGMLNIAKNTINVKMNMKTDVGTKLSKVPLVGYIIMGDDGSVSTTLKLSGKLDDPTVKNALAEDIVTAPVNIIKRTLMTPFRIFDFIAKEAEKQQERQEQ